MPLARCPICGKAFDAGIAGSTPFCGPKCRQIDLGRWLDERYSVPVEEIDEEGTDEPTAEQD